MGNNFFAVHVAPLSRSAYGVCTCGNVPRNYSVAYNCVNRRSGDLLLYFTLD